MREVHDVSELKLHSHKRLAIDGRSLSYSRWCEIRWRQFGQFPAKLVAIPREIGGQSPQVTVVFDFRGNF
eukprot:g36218.t1